MKRFLLFENWTFFCFLLPLSVSKLVSFKFVGRITQVLGKFPALKRKAASLQLTKPTLRIAEALKTKELSLSLCTSHVPSGYPPLCATAKVVCQIIVEIEWDDMKSKTKQKKQTKKSEKTFRHHEQFLSYLKAKDKEKL